MDAILREHAAAGGDPAAPLPGTEVRDNRPWLTQAAEDRLFPWGDLLAVCSLADIDGAFPQSLYDAANEERVRYIVARVPGAGLLTRPDGAPVRLRIWQHGWRRPSMRAPAHIERAAPGSALEETEVLVLRNRDYWSRQPLHRIRAECLVGTLSVAGSIAMPVHVFEHARRGFLQDRAGWQPLNPMDAPPSYPGAAYAYAMAGAEGDYGSTDMGMAGAEPAEPDPGQQAVAAFVGLIKDRFIPLGNVLDLDSLAGVTGEGWPAVFCRAGLDKLPDIALAAMRQLEGTGRPWKLAHVTRPVETFGSVWHWPEGEREPRQHLRADYGPRTRLYVLRHGPLIIAERPDGYIVAEALAAAETEGNPITPRFLVREWRAKLRERGRFYPGHSPYHPPPGARLANDPAAGLAMLGLEPSAKVLEKLRAETAAKGRQGEEDRLAAKRARQTAASGDEDDGPRKRTRRLFP